VSPIEQQMHYLTFMEMLQVLILGVKWLNVMLQVMILEEGSLIEEQMQYLTFMEMLQV
jgi:hypothetical protein